MKTVVIYKSQTGFTKKYAEWISEELLADIFEVSEVTSDTLIQYDIIIYGGSLHAVGISGVKIITENINKFKDKKVVVFATGASPKRESVINEVRDKNFTEDKQKSIKFFYLRGGFNYKGLKMVDRFLMQLLKFKIKSKKREELTSDEIGMLAVYDKPVDFTRKKDIDKIIDYIKS